MTLQARLALFITAVGADLKLLFSHDMPTGGTTGQVLTKSSAADYATAWATPAATGPAIDDTAPAANKVYSSNKTESVATAAANAAKAAILGAASPAYDTLVEIQSILQGDDTSIANLLTAVGTRVDTGAAQSFTTGQKAQARTNIDAYGSVELGNPDTDLVALYVTAKQ